MANPPVYTCMYVCMYICMYVYMFCMYMYRSVDHVNLHDIVWPTSLYPMKLLYCTQCLSDTIPLVTVIMIVPVMTLYPRPLSACDYDDPVPT